MLPRYFVPRAEPEPVAALRGPLLTTVRDAFRLGGTGRSQREMVVVGDRSGTLHLVDDPGALPATQREQLHHHELLTRGPPRVVAAEELWLFALAMVEQPADAPGLNDPIWLYGRLFGPHPGGEAVTVEGQLTVTRADLLAGFVRGAPDALHVHATPATRCLHALLPADREDVVEAGRGLVLLYPTIPQELAPTDAGNEALVAQILHDVLSATQQDATRNKLPHPLVGKTLPVPSREDLERELDAKGWDVRGNTAYRRSEATKKGSLGGFLSQVFGVPDHMTLPLPPEATLDEFLVLAKEALPGFPGFPDRRAHAIGARTGRGSAPPTAARPIHVPRPSGDPPPPPSQVRTVPPTSDPRPPPKVPKPSGDAWMGDFVAQHAPPGSGKKPRLTPSAPRSKGKPAQPDWMKDFED